MSHKGPFHVSELEDYSFLHTVPENSSKILTRVIYFMALFGGIGSHPITWLCCPSLTIVMMWQYGMLGVI